MADLIFDRGTKTLSWPKMNSKWSAVSGPFGAGALPVGYYRRVGWGEARTPTRPREH